jgi:DNA ligase (NAD+)
MDIRGLGSKLADQLVAKGILENLADIYELTTDDLKRLLRMGDKSARNIVNSIARSKENAKLDRLIYALGIPHVGRALATDLAAHFGVIDKVAGADERALKTAGLGTVVSSAVARWFSNRANQELIRRLKHAGIDPQLQRKGHRLEGKTLVFTGELDRLTRDQAKDSVIQQGGRVSESLSRHTDFLVVGASPGGTKTANARKYRTKSLSEAEFLRLIRQP